MKRVMGLLAGMMILGGAACGSKQQEPAPSNEPVAVEKKAEKADDHAANAHASTKAEGHSCGDHAVADKGTGTYNEKDCPFEHERAAFAKAEPAPAPAPHAHEGGGCDSEPMPGPGGAQHLGGAFTLTEAKPLATVLGAATVEKEELVRVAGTVEKVCQKKGCWMVVKDGELEARVIMKDHSFAIPFDSKGMKASIEGTLKVKVFTEAQAKHLAEDGKEDPAKVTGEKKEFLLTATSVQLGG